jgi:antimicrobial peptide system SdpB family protein
METQIREFNPFTSVVGIVRTILATATAITFSFNDAASLFPQMPRSMVPGPYCNGIRGIGAFCLEASAHEDIARWVCVALLLVVASGWRPRFTGVVHAWITFSLAASSPMLDGGDQVATVLTLLLLPITLTDPRRWHWQSLDVSRTSPYTRMVSWVVYQMIRVQVAGIYFHAAVGKTAVDDWANGTALYYWLRHPYVGVGGIAASIFLPITSSGTLCALMTWGVLALEFLLAAAVIMSPRAQRPLMLAGIALHLGILWLHGLVSFGLTMVAALLIYLMPLGSPLGMPAWIRLPRRSRAPGKPAAAETFATIYEATS